MNKLNNLMTYLFVALFVVATASCGLTDKEDKSYDGSTKLGFRPLESTIKEDNVAIAKIQLIGPQRDKPTELEYSVVKSDTDPKPGKYSIKPKSPVTIEADSSQVVLQVSVPKDPSLKAGKKENIKLKIEGKSDVKAAKNFKYFNLTVVGK